MAGRIAEMIGIIIQKRSRGNETLIATTKTKLILKGIDPGKYTSLSDDDPVIIEKLTELAKDLSITF